jgi:hypothetical protein
VIENACSRSRINTSVAFHSENAETREADGEPELADKEKGKWEIEATNGFVFGENGKRNENDDQEERDKEKERKSNPTKEDNEEYDLDDAITSRNFRSHIARMISRVVDVGGFRLGLQGGILAWESMKEHLRCGSSGYAETKWPKTNRQKGAKKVRIRERKTNILAQ